MKRFLAPLLTAALCATAGTAAAMGDVEAGKQKSAPCQACHGADGNAGVDPQYPRLAGQYRDYLERSLLEYKSGARANPIMAGFVAPLSTQDIADLSAYFASLPTESLIDLHNQVQGD
ncbi:MAG TPA: cytochrome c [Dokdonella sp.]